MFLHEGHGAEQAQFLALVQQQDDGVTRRRPLLEDARDFQDRGDRSAIVRGSRPRSHRVVMSRKQDRIGSIGGSIGCRYPHEDVGRRGAHGVLRIANEGLALQFRRIAKRTQLRHDASAQQTVRLAADRMRYGLADELAQQRETSPRGELPGRCVRAQCGPRFKGE